MINFTLASSSPQHDEKGVLLLEGVVSVECVHDHLARLHVGLINDEGSETAFAQGVDLGIADLRALGRALVATAEYMEGAKHGA